jgi:hypothetical protein
MHFHLDELLYKIKYVKNIKVLTFIHNDDTVRINDCYCKCYPKAAQFASAVHLLSGFFALCENYTPRIILNYKTVLRVLYCAPCSEFGFSSITQDFDPSCGGALINKGGRQLKLS